MTTSSTNNSVFRGFFEKQKLTGPNFIDWYRQLRIVLSIDDKLNYLEQPLPILLHLNLPRLKKGLKALFAQQAEHEASTRLTRHISKKRIEKLQHDGLLNSTDLRAFEKCVSCMSGKMARKPYTHQVERAKDLLGLIHTDVCDPFRTVSRQGASYFVTFTNEFSRYGEYMSQEFLDHLKEHGIIAHRTPPYTPQHNGVSERRNRTLLDMVRSMMSQINLPKSFWDYALETAVRILNMVPTKKVEKTPYEVWPGQAPKLSYLKVWGCEALVKRDTLTKPNKL
ncbi:retrotransposon protein, putative, ty1-copia subclass, partial [Tanacetum coccineum]